MRFRPNNPAEVTEMRRSWFRLNWLVVRIAAAAIVLAGFFGGGISDGLGFVLAPLALSRWPTPMEAARFWVFMGWCLWLFLVAVAVSITESAATATAKERRRTERNAMVMTAIVSCPAVMATVFLIAMEVKSRQYVRISKHYSDLCSQYKLTFSPKGGIIPDDASEMNGRLTAISMKWSKASLAPWRTVAPDPPELK